MSPKRSGAPFGHAARFRGTVTPMGKRELHLPRGVTGRTGHLEQLGLWGHPWALLTHPCPSPLASTWTSSTQLPSLRPGADSPGAPSQAPPPVRLRAAARRRGAAGS